MQQRDHAYLQTPELVEHLGSGVPRILEFFKHNQQSHHKNFKKKYTQFRTNKAFLVGYWKISTKNEITESQLEQAFIELLAKEEIPHLFGQAIQRSSEEVLIKKDLKNFL